MNLSLVIFGLIFTFSNIVTIAYASTIPWPTSDPSLPEIQMQVIMRDSNGALIAYFEPTLWYIADVSAVHALLDTKEKKTLVHKYNNDYQRIEFTNHFVISETGQITSEPLYYDGKAVLNPRHDAVVLQNGDTIDVHWNILRTVR